MKFRSLTLPAVAAFATILGSSSPASAQSILKTAGNYAVLAGQGITVAGAGFTVKNGNVGLYPAATTNITGFPPGTVSGTTLLGTAAAIIATELVCGAASLCWPSAGWVNLAVLALACGFTIVAVIGYTRFRGRPCRCFGALTRRSFSVRSLTQSLVILAVAALATRPAGDAAVAIGLTAHLLLLAVAGLLALAACTAAKALATPEVAT